MDRAKFRKELERIMPGYAWTVHREKYKDFDFIEATGIQYLHGALSDEPIDDGEHPVAKVEWSEPA